jgi:hypothetical protein
MAREKPLQHTSAYVSIHTSAYVSIRQHTSAYIRQHTSAYVRYTCRRVVTAREKPLHHADSQPPQPICRWICAPSARAPLPLLRPPPRGGASYSADVYETTHALCGKRRVFVFETRLNNGYTLGAHHFWAGTPEVCAFSLAIFFKKVFSKVLFRVSKLANTSP